MNRFFYWEKTVQSVVWQCSGTGRHAFYSMEAGSSKHDTGVFSFPSRCTCIFSVYFFIIYFLFFQNWFRTIIMTTKKNKSVFCIVCCNMLSCQTSVFVLYIFATSGYIVCVYMCNGVEWSKDRTQAVESIKWRPQQAYGSSQVLLSQPQTIFSTHKILMLTHR